MLPACTFAILLRLLAPADGTELAGGASATLEWRETAPLPAHVEEWEAFLSVDGGHYYALRITPHLDRDLRRFTFTVPNVASDDARILLRFGDEERETEVELPVQLRIRFDPLAPRAWPVFEEEEGESAREGEEPVHAWLAGERDGSELRAVAHRDASCDSHEVHAVHWPQAGSADEPEDDELALPCCRMRAFVVATQRASRVRAPRAEQDPLLETMRLNI
jgi:hypothetical protein